MAIFITGDTHGEFTRFKREIFYEQAGLTKEDFVIICGDFGGLWCGSKEERFWLDWLEGRPFTTLFVSGNHENYDLLGELPTEDWQGGVIQRVRPSVLHLTRGQVFTLQGRTFFTMGGAACHDVDGGILEPEDPQFRRKRRMLDHQGALYRVNHQSWWREELPCEAEYRTARENLERCGWAVDYVITHCGPTSVQRELGGGLYRADALTDFLEETAERCRFRAWYLGHYHVNRVVRERFAALYEQIVPLKL